MQRRAFLAILAAAGPILEPWPSPAHADGVDADDPAAPQGGNPKGDVLVAAFFDYNCPYCRRAEPELRRFVETDRGVRLVYRDWPVLGEASVTAARLALAARYQDRYEAAHQALMALKGRRGGRDLMREALAADAGIDTAQLGADAARHAAEISGQLARTDARARALGLKAVPAFIVGGRMVVGGFDAENFSEFAAGARAVR